MTEQEILNLKKCVVADATHIYGKIFTLNSRKERNLSSFLF
jgi:hypothetical protein